MGYKLVKVHEVWHYEHQSDPNDTSSKNFLFTYFYSHFYLAFYFLAFFGAYVNAFLKLKQQASGYPKTIKTEEEKDHFVEEFYQNEGVQLEKDKIELNPGFRLIAKLCLNSFWCAFRSHNHL